MSWADDIRCLYCDGRLPLYRKITNGQFCSAAHRKAYWSEQERLAVERLHQTHDSLKSYRAPAEDLEAILGAPLPNAAPPIPHDLPEDEIFRPFAPPEALEPPKPKAAKPAPRRYRDEELTVE